MTAELSRLAASREGLCRVVLRLWREFVFPSLGYEWAVSYSDNAIHRGELYRCDGWQKVAQARSGTDRRSGRPGRNKSVWVWPRPDICATPKNETLPTAAQRPSSATA